MTKTMKKNMDTEIDQELLIDKENFTEHVWIPIGEVEKWTGADPAKIRYWTDQGYVRSQGDGRYRYRFTEIQKIKLIRYLTDKGVEPKLAAYRVNTFWKEYKEAQEEPKDQVRTISGAVDRLEAEENGLKEIAEELVNNENLRKLLMKEFIERIAEEKSLNLHDLIYTNDRS